MMALFSLLAISIFLKNYIITAYISLEIHLLIEGWSFLVHIFLIFYFANLKMDFFHNL